MIETTTNEKSIKDVKKKQVKKKVLHAAEISFSRSLILNIN